MQCAKGQPTRAKPRGAAQTAGLRHEYIKFKFQNFGARNSKFLHVAVGAEPERENVRLSRHQDSGQGDGWKHQRQKLPREDSQRQRKSWKAENR